jgi:hypothetical protein
MDIRKLVFRDKINYKEGNVENLLDKTLKKYET